MPANSRWDLIRRLRVKVVPVPAMKVYGGREGTFSVLNLGHRRR